MIFSGTTAKMILPGCQETYGKPSSNSLGSIEASMFSAEEEHVGSSVQKNRCATAPDPWLSRSPSTAPSNCVYSLQLSGRTGGGCGWASGRGSRFEEAFNAPKIGPLATYPSRGHVANEKACNCASIPGANTAARMRGTVFRCPKKYFQPNPTPRRPNR